MNSDRDCASLQLDVAESYDAMSRRAEQLVVSELKRRPNLIFCASAGGTPTRLYELMAARHKRQPGLFKKMRVLQIDEWGGLPKRHPASCETDLRVKLLDPLGIGSGRYTGFRTDSPSPKTEVARISGWLSEHGPIDICILGLGVNGHVAMNEPAPELSPRAHVSRLNKSSLNHPMLKQLDHKPSYGLTIGMGDILSSRMILLMVNGSHKRAAVERVLESKVTTRFPASFVWLHPNAYLLCDRAAAP